MSRYLVNLSLEVLFCYLIERVFLKDKIFVPLFQILPLFISFRCTKLIDEFIEKYPHFFKLPDFFPIDLEPLVSSVGNTAFNDFRIPNYFMVVIFNNKSTSWLFTWPSDITLSFTNASIYYSRTHLILQDCIISKLQKEQQSVEKSLVQRIPQDRNFRRVFERIHLKT